MRKDTIVAQICNSTDDGVETIKNRDKRKEAYQ